MDEPEFRDAIAAVAALDEPVRRALYQHVARQPHDVSRDEAARAVGISRLLAAFHLDKLVAAGLLQASYRRVSGRQGPGAGRPSKLYRRSDHEIEVSLPQRRYELIAGLFADSLEDPGASGARDVLSEGARRLGTKFGKAARQRAGARVGQRRLRQLAVEELAKTGFQPNREGDVTWLRNCPFDGVAKAHQDLMCGTNLSFIRGLLKGLDVRGITTVLDPAPGRCCVALRS